MSNFRIALLGSAAALVVAGAAHAADLPTKKGAPATEYVKVCQIDGVAGFVIPGSDTCLKITGYITAQILGGNLSQQYVWAGNGGSSEKALAPGTPTNQRDAFGMSTRAELEFIAKTNTAYGTLTSDLDTEYNYGSGFDSFGPGAGFIQRAYVNWAGLTAGKANSYFAFFGAGPGWADIFSPDRQTFNQPLLLAYTATFGGGFSATVSLEDPVLTGPGSALPPYGGSDVQITANSQYLGQRAPDVVGSLDLKQGWGGAHLAGVAHNVVMTDGVNNLDTWGYAIDAGLKFNLPMLGDPSDNVQFQGVWTRNAVWYSGIPDGMWDENGQVNGNGVMMPVGDAYSNLNGTWATPTAWSVGAIGEYHLGPHFSIDPEVSYAQLTWSGLNGGMAGALSTDSQSWIFGGVANWTPVPHLDIAFEALYQTTHQSMPAAFSVPAGDVAWKSTTTGAETRLSITREF
ncbi:MAG: porin [Hyphomicrobiales bacterium]|nr:porin [Hyphomicrobiales bacterium]